MKVPSAAMRLLYPHSTDRCSLRQWGTTVSLATLISKVSPILSEASNLRLNLTTKSESSLRRA